MGRPRRRQRVEATFKLRRALLLHPADGQEDAVQQGMRVRRTAGNVDIHGNDGIHGAAGGVVPPKMPPLQPQAPTATTKRGSGVAS